MAGVVGVFNKPAGFVHTAACVEVLDGGKLTSADLLGRQHDPLQRLVVEGSAVPIPGRDPSSQGTLSGASVKGPQESWPQATLLQPPYIEKVLLCLLSHMTGVYIPGEVLCNVDTVELEAADSLYHRPLDGDGIQPHSSPPVVHDQLLGLAGVECQVVFLTPLCQVVDVSSVVLLVVVSEQANHCRIVGKLDQQVGAVRGHAAMAVQGVKERAHLVHLYALNGLPRWYLSCISHCDLFKSKCSKPSQLT